MGITNDDTLSENRPADSDWVENWSYTRISKY